MPKRTSEKRRHSSSSCSRSEASSRKRRKRKDDAKERSVDRNKAREREREKDKGSAKERDRDRDRKKSRSGARKKSRSRDRKKSGSRARRQRSRSSKRSPSRSQRSSSRSRARRTRRSSSRRSEDSTSAGRASPVRGSPESGGVTNGGAEAASRGAPGSSEPPKRSVLGDLAELQKKLQEDRDMLQLYVLKAKQELEEKLETEDRRERREREYYKPSCWGEPCGPENRYLLEGEVGRGAFSTVFKGRDAQQGKEYAIKFVRQNAMLRKATEKEVKLMRRLRSQASVEDPDGARCLLGLAGPETFEHEGHLAVVVQLQRCDLRTGLQKYGQGKGLPLSTVQCYGGHLFKALRALRKLNIIHSDVKPDNLLISLDKATVKLSDFGSAMPMSERIRTDHVQPRFYRAPEVFLGQSYDMQIDIWSAALTLFELATGQILFQGKTNNDMVHEMLKVCGGFSKQFATSGDYAMKYFNAQGEFRLQDPDVGPGSEVITPMTSFPKAGQPPQPFQHLLEEHIKVPPPGSNEGRQTARLRRLADLLARCIVPVPAKRMLPEAILGHQFFQNSPT